MSDAHGTVWWTELNTRDPAAACAFYAKHLGWTYDTMPISGGTGDYFIAMRDGRPVAGILDISVLPGMEGVSAHWFTYLGVADVDQHVEDIIADGGTVVRPPWDIPNAGRVALIKDPTGAVVGVMTPVSRE